MHTIQTMHTPLTWDESLIKRFDLSGPRYTSYPTAPHFSPAFNLEDWRAAALRSDLSQAPLSIYCHIPFCETVCYYCGCNKIITANKKRALPYLAALKTEITLQAQYFNNQRPVVQFHFGGGTPTYLSDDQLTDLMAHFRKHFNFATEDQLEASIEIHPQTVTPERLAALKKLGLNRISLGIQDFNAEVQKAVNRFNSAEEVAHLCQAARRLDFKSISMDLIYGLPKQTPASFSATVDSIIALKPDRLSLFSYAHMPHLFKVQQQIIASDLPSSRDKLSMLHLSIDKLQAAGYRYIGMDHFALPDDELAQAQDAGQLHRNFQGYSTRGGCDLLAFGVSAINQVNDTYAQNFKDITAYQNALEQGQLPLHKGLRLSRDDIIRKAVINQLICHFHLQYQAIEARFGLVFKDYFADALAELAPLAEANLCRLSDTGIHITDPGR
ncbi:MAG TPA: oxygen-independent coproporphyrinogen III oxidase, partial [Cellvibrionaceae bacterium]|nr:oxygen-independent coproporphyrinogen III oxidase [Cellvibrionaceae bacterium]